MGDLPHYLKSGEQARLIPIVADTNRESRTTSVLLASLTALPDLAHAVFSSVGQSIGKRSVVSAFTEVVPTSSVSRSKDRPDGLVVIETGRRSWSAFLEVKIGNGQLSADQIERYVELAKNCEVDAVITISNQFTARPDHHPIQVPRTMTRKVKLYHWPWMWILIVRFLSHDSTGIDGFDRMNKEWKDVVLAVQSGAVLRKSAHEIENTVASWHEEERDMCLILSRHLGRPVRLKLERKHRDAPLDRLKDDGSILAEKKKLRCAFHIPDAASDLSVVVDLRTRSVACGMRMEAPRDKKSTKARVNWLLRQLSKTDDPDIYVKASWPSRAPDTIDSLARVRENPEILQTENQKLAPHSFEVQLIRDLAGKFSGSRTFIEHLEAAVPRFYDQVGQHLRAWQAPPPKPRGQNVTSPPVDESEEPETAQFEQSPVEAAQPGSLLGHRR
ncbi:MAG: hypothetical protein P8Z76_11950 [Alphaproteobacteria bacterium]